MSTDETQALKEDVAEIKSDVKEMRKDISDLAVVLAGNYITRNEFEQYKRDQNEDFEQYQKEQVASRRFWAGSIVAGAGAIAGLVNAVSALIHK